MFLNRRKSFDVMDKTEPKGLKQLQRRNSAIITQCMSPKTVPFSRRNSEISIAEIQKISIKESEKSASTAHRRFSTISAPKEICIRETCTKPIINCNGSKLTRRYSSDHVTLPRIPSATPEPDIVSLASQKDISYDVDGNLYKPKHCWCFRCQIMYSMYRNGDDRLAMWGNYPCFRR
ncbi:hypothetical protein ACF0H5_000245 [Mactra antiquata]